VGLAEKLNKMDELIELFDKHREYFGLSDCLEEQCEFEDKFNALVCELRGHDIGPDHCGIPEHDLCYRCQRRLVEIEAQ